MTLFPIEDRPRPSGARGVSAADVDEALGAQILVAWAGEHGEGPRPQRLGWWRTDLHSEFGGLDLLRRLTPLSWRWAALQALRTAARTCDAHLRSRDHEPDQVRSLYSLGFEVDERLDERLRELRLTGTLPEEALPSLELIVQGWSRDRFMDWVDSHGTVKSKPTPLGRELEGNADELTPGQLVQRCVAGLAGATDQYPLPHVRRRS